LPTAGEASAGVEFRNPIEPIQEEPLSVPAIAQDSAYIRLFTESETREAV
jgi:hypothetical protein